MKYIVNKNYKPDLNSWPYKVFDDKPFIEFEPAKSDEKEEE